jgi:hypothetical protein
MPSSAQNVVLAPFHPKFRMVVPFDFLSGPFWELVLGREIDYVGQPPRA